MRSVLRLALRLLSELSLLACKGLFRRPYALTPSARGPPSCFPFFYRLACCDRAGRALGMCSLSTPPAESSSSTSIKPFGSELFRLALPLLPHSTLHGTPLPRHPIATADARCRHAALSRVLPVAGRRRRRCCFSPQLRRHGQDGRRSSQRRLPFCC